MSDEWQTYRCLIDDHPAVITYDHGLSDEFEGLNFGNVAIFRIPIPNPDERGLPVGDAFDHLNALEDYLMELLPPELTPEGLRVLAGVTYFGSNAKARRELGYTPRSLEEGLRETLAQEMRNLGMTPPSV